MERFKCKFQTGEYVTQMNNMKKGKRGSRH